MPQPMVQAATTQTSGERRAERNSALNKASDPLNRAGTTGASIRDGAAFAALSQGANPLQQRRPSKRLGSRYWKACASKMLPWQSTVSFTPIQFTSCAVQR